MPLASGIPRNKFYTRDIDTSAVSKMDTGTQSYSNPEAKQPMHASTTSKEPTLRVKDCTYHINTSAASSNYQSHGNMLEHTESLPHALLKPTSTNRKSTGANLKLTIKKEIPIQCYTADMIKVTGTTSVISSQLFFNCNTSTDKVPHTSKVILENNANPESSDSTPHTLSQVVSKQQ